jgi:tRNA-specific 2-thiouridylase
MIDQAQLAQTRFPVGALTKAEVRAEATRLGLRTAAKADSQDVCFITSRGRATFLGHRTALRPAQVVDTAGRPVGTVPAVELVTVGQRKGLGLLGGGPARYVVDVDAVGAVVTVGDRDDLLVAAQAVRACTWVDKPRAGDVLVQCSAHGAPAPAVVEVDDHGARVTWREPQRRVAPGQSVVFYDATDTYVLGGATAC